MISGWEKDPAEQETWCQAVISRIQQMLPDLNCLYTDTSIKETTVILISISGRLRSEMILKKETKEKRNNCVTHGHRKTSKK